MDIVHHAMIGAVGALFSAVAGEPVAGCAFLVGSVLPDLDMAFVALGKRRYLELHQGPTHSLFAAPLVAALAALGTLLIPGAGTLGGGPGICFLAALGGVCLHATLDLCNTFGIRPLWPLKTRVSLDAAFFVDLPTLCATALAMAALAAGWAAPWGVLGAYASSCCAYLALRLYLQRAARRALRADTVIPSGVFPFGAFVTRTVSGGIECGWVNTLTGRYRVSKRLPPVDAAVLALARKSAVYRGMEAALRRLTPVDVRRGADGAVETIVARCVAVPNFGNRYGEVALRFRSGKLVGEHARI
jgi:membrane-bound metal-dependent hydrolase YbcI (DUF457 family)